FIMYYGCLSMITPPVAIASYVAANIAGADQNRTGWASMTFGWTIYIVPFLFVFSDTLLMKGAPWAIVLDFATALAGVWFISAAFMGYAIGKLSLAQRGLYAVAGLFLMMPVGAFDAAKWFNLAGAAVAIGLVFYARGSQ